MPPELMGKFQPKQQGGEKAKRQQRQQNSLRLTNFFSTVSPGLSVFTEGSLFPHAFNAIWGVLLVLSSFFFQSSLVLYRILVSSSV